MVCLPRSFNASYDHLKPEFWQFCIIWPHYFDEGGGIFNHHHHGEDDESNYHDLVPWDFLFLQPIQLLIYVTDNAEAGACDDDYNDDGDKVNDYDDDDKDDGQGVSALRFHHHHHHHQIHQYQHHDQPQSSRPPLSPECNAAKCQEGTLGGIKRETE